MNDEKKTVSVKRTLAHFCHSVLQKGATEPPLKRFQNLTLEQVQALDKVLTDVIPIHGRGNFPTLQVRAKDIIRVVKDRLVERNIQVKDVRLNGATASHVLLRDNGLGYRDLDIIFGVELPRQEDLQVIKEVVLGSLRDLLPYGVNRRKITCLTMKEAYVQKMVKVFNENDRWSLISLSNNRAKTVGLRFVSSLRRQFEFSVDSFQIILDRMLESYWEAERRQGRKAPSAVSSTKSEFQDEPKEGEQSSVAREAEARGEKGSAMAACPDQPQERELPPAEAEGAEGNQEAATVKSDVTRQEEEEEEEAGSIEDVSSEEDIAFEENVNEKERGGGDDPSASPPETLLTDVPPTSPPCIKQHSDDAAAAQASPAASARTEKSAARETERPEEPAQLKAGSVLRRAEDSSCPQDLQLEFSFPPPAKKTCSTSQDVVPGYCPLPKLQRKMSRKMLSKPEKWSLLTDLSDLTTQMFPPIETPKPLQASRPSQDRGQDHSRDVPKTEASDVPTAAPRAPAGTSPFELPATEPAEQSVKPKHSKKPPDSASRRSAAGPDAPSQPHTSCQTPRLEDSIPQSSLAEGAPEPGVLVEAECMYGDFGQAMDHLRHRLIATHSPEEIRGGGLLKYSDLLVRNFRPASETEIKSLERYMCSRFFIDFPDVSEQQRKIEAYLQCHFIGNEEASKYDYLMTLRRVIDESTVCLMGHERRQTLNMITVLALRVLGEQNAIPNTANVTCFYQPAPYVSEPIYSSYFVPQAQPPLVYHPYPLHVHMQTGLV